MRFQKTLERRRQNRINFKIVKLRNGEMKIEQNKTEQNIQRIFLPSFLQLMYLLNECA